MTSDEEFVKSEFYHHLEDEKTRRESRYYKQVNLFIHEYYDQLVSYMLNMRTNSLHLQDKKDISEQILKINKELRILKDMLGEKC